MDKRRASVLRAIGLGPVWRLRTVAQADANENDMDIATAAADAAQRAARSVRPTARAADLATTPAPSSAPAHEPHSEPHIAPALQPARAQRLQAGESERDARIATLDWDALESDIRACRACELCQQRTQAVPGVGDRKARWLLVGEGPGREEDLRGEPFVGPAGQLLDRMLAAIGLARGTDVYIANAIKCRPPHNRTPQASEVERCLPYLHRQIELLQPTLIVALGRPAALALLGREISIAAARGHIFQLPQGGPPVVVTYHPAYLLRNPQDKAKAWEDLCFARRSMAGFVSTAR